MDDNISNKGETTMGILICVSAWVVMIQVFMIILEESKK
jgi:hypothetical protein